jgi:hypothetical protein
MNTSTDIFDRTITLERAARIEKARLADLRAARLERLFSNPWLVAAVLLACILLASYGDTLAGINPA